MDAVGGGGGSGNPPYTSSFLVGNWSLDGGVYKIQVLESTHGLGTEIQVQVFEKVGSDYRQLEVDVFITTAGDITLSISSSPDLRFEGKLTIVGE